MKACLPAVKCLTLRYTSDEKNKFALPLTQSFKRLETNDDNQSRSIFSHFVVWLISRIINRQKKTTTYTILVRVVASTISSIYRYPGVHWLLNLSRSSTVPRFAASGIRKVPERSNRPTILCDQPEDKRVFFIF